VVNAKTPDALPTGITGTHFVGGLVGLRDCLDGAENLATSRIGSPDRPSCSAFRAQ
jgi:hypothetical protein